MARDLRDKSGATDWQELFGHALNVYEQLLVLDGEQFRLYAASKDLGAVISIRGLRLKKKPDIAHIPESGTDDVAWN